MLSANSEVRVVFRIFQKRLIEETNCFNHMCVHLLRFYFLNFAAKEDQFLPECEFGQFNRQLFSLAQENSFDLRSVGGGLMFTKKGLSSLPNTNYYSGQRFGGIYSSIFKDVASRRSANRQKFSQELMRVSSGYNAASQSRIHFLQQLVPLAFNVAFFLVILKLWSKPWPFPPYSFKIQCNMLI